MLSRDLINLSAGLAEAVRTQRVTPELVRDAALQLSGMVAQAAALEANPMVLQARGATPPEVSPSVEAALEVLRQAMALEVRTDLARAS